jgi:hypothetical protein
MCKIIPGKMKQYPATTNTSQAMPVKIFPLYICPAPGMNKLSTAAVPGFQIR